MTESIEIAQQLALDQSFAGRKRATQKSLAHLKQSAQDVAISQSFGVFSKAQGGCDKPNAVDVPFTEDGAAL